MGFKSLFKKKKKRLQTPENSNAANANSSSMNSSRIDEELEQVFKKFDVNGDGKISSSELRSIMNSLGHQASEEELEMMIKEVDSDGDGFIDLQEFIALNTDDVGCEETMENLKEAFSVFDIDKNGRISAEELQKVLKSLDEDCSLAECRKMISGVDCDGDGMINFEEFKVMMTNGLGFEMDSKASSSSNPKGPWPVFGGAV